MDSTLAPLARPQASAHPASELREGLGITVSVVLCAYTLARAARLAAAIDSVRTQEPPAREILLVVDHNEELLDWVGTHLAQDPAAPLVKVLPSAGPPGLSGARNTGLAVASGEVVAFLDDDAEAEPDWLARLVAPYADPTVVSVGGSVLPAWETSQPRWFPEEFGWVVGCSYRGQPTVLGEVRNAIGANISFRRSSLIAAGGFSTAVGRQGADARGCEETEASIRVRRLTADARVLLEPAARVRHHVPAQRATWAYFRRRCYAEGQSKALVARLVGRDDALASERAYVRATLPEGVARALARTWRHRDPSELAPAATITGGLAVTALGYALASLRKPGSDERRPLARAGSLGPTTPRNPARQEQALR
ncbi:MAG TPA: glycosyltransferase family 2 protein [Candidatus Nanopelagicales bacterium]